MLDKPDNNKPGFCKKKHGKQKQLKYEHCYLPKQASCNLQYQFPFVGIKININLSVDSKLRTKCKNGILS